MFFSLLCNNLLGRYLNEIAIVINNPNFPVLRKHYDEKYIPDISKIHLKRTGYSWRDWNVITEKLNNIPLSHMRHKRKAIIKHIR